MIKEPHNKNYQDKCCENCQHKASNTGSSENIKEIKASTCLAFEEIEADVASFHTNIICAECGETVEILTKTHIAKHGLTQAEYLHRHPHHCYLHMWPDLPNSKNQEKYRKWREKLGVAGKIGGQGVKKN